MYKKNIWEYIQHAERHKSSIPQYEWGYDEENNKNNDKTQVGICSTRMFTTYEKKT